jgi:hypothetical protein
VFIYRLHRHGIHISTLTVFSLLGAIIIFGVILGFIRLLFISQDEIKKDLRRGYIWIGWAHPVKPDNLPLPYTPSFLLLLANWQLSQLLHPAASDLLFVLKAIPLLLTITLFLAAIKLWTDNIQHWIMLLKYSSSS